MNTTKNIQGSLLAWAQLETAPKSSGIYAWYYKPILRTFDIVTIINELNGCESDIQLEKLDKFLRKHMFDLFAEEPYEVTFKGPLKPTYEGKAESKLELNKEFLERLMKFPEKLYSLKTAIENSFPSFHSPIYIGKSKNLRKRLLKHKELIDRYKSNSVSTGTAEEGSDARDQSFAKGVVGRGMNETRLYVAVYDFKTHVDEQKERGNTDEEIDVEYILNRINFPLFGRN